MLSRAACTPVLVLGTRLAGRKYCIDIWADKDLSGNGPDRLRVMDVLRPLLSG